MSPPPGERHERRAARAAAASTPRRTPRKRWTPRGARAWGRAVSSVMIATGAMLLTDGGATLVWQEPVTALLGARAQAGLADDLDRLRRAEPTPLERRALSELNGERARIAFLARSLGRRARPGEAIARLRIARMDLSSVVVAGSADADLRKGPGAYSGVPLPGVGGTAAIAGHRTTFGAPFRDLDRMREGDRIDVELPYATFTYAVERTRIVAPDDLSVLARRSYDRLVLSACHPLFSAAERIVVLARLVRTEPAATLRRPR